MTRLRWNVPFARDGLHIAGVDASGSGVGSDNEPDLVAGFDGFHVWLLLIADGWSTAFGTGTSLFPGLGGSPKG